MPDSLRDKVLSVFRRKTHAYQRVFNGPLGQIVLEDLAKFCRSTEPTFDKDERIHALLEGRREVWLRIAKHLNLTPEQQYALRFPDVPSPERNTDG